MNPCLSCGACCGTFRVSFYWGEPVPEEFTEKVNDFYACMKGTGAPVASTVARSAVKLDVSLNSPNSPNSPRCVCLSGNVGKQVDCQIYSQRPTPCRNFLASYEEVIIDKISSRVVNERCDQARASKGLQALTLQDWID